MVTPSFKKRLVEGHKTENFVAAQLRAAGIEVEQPEYPEGMPRSYYTKQQIDLIANGRIIEVKGRNLSFTGLEDYPFDTIFVGAQKAFDGKEHKPAYYLSVSNIDGGIIALPVERTYDQWRVEETVDRSRGHRFNIYNSDRSLWISFVQLVLELRNEI